MSTAQNTLRSSIASHAPGRLPAGLYRLLDEVRVLADTLLHPARAVAEVEAMRKLIREADAVEARDPERAARLRERASRIGLR